MDILKNLDLLKTTDDATAILILDLAIEGIDELLEEKTNHSGSEIEELDENITLTLQAEREELARQIQAIQKRVRLREDNSARNSTNSSSRQSRPRSPISQPSNSVDKELLEGMVNLLSPKESKKPQNGDLADKDLRNLSPRSAARKRWKDVSYQGPSLENEEGESPSIGAGVQIAEAETTNTKSDKTEHEEHALRRSSSMGAKARMAKAKSERVKRTMSRKETEEESQMGNSPTAGKQGPTAQSEAKNHTPNKAKPREANMNEQPRQTEQQASPPGRLKDEKEKKLLQSESPAINIVENYKQPDAVELVKKAAVEIGQPARMPHVGASPEAGSSMKTKIEKAEKGEEKRACLICINEFPTSQITELSCGHECCKACIAELFIRATNNEASYPPKCCKPISLNRIRASLDEDVIRNFLERKVEWDSTSRIYCSNRQCNAFIRPENIHQRDAICIKCRTRTCARCKKAFHKDNEPCSADKEDQQTLQLMKKKRWKQCPKCSAGVSRSYGCNTMTYVTSEPYIKKDC